MLVLVHSSPTTLDKHRHPNLGVLMSPRRFYPGVGDAAGWRWAADNDAYSDWNPQRFSAMLDAIRHWSGCLFVSSPDVVGDHAATLALYYAWQDRLAACGQPIAFVAQDGASPDDVPWSDVEALFVGGSTEYKMGAGARELIVEAKRRRLWVHIGRVNGHRRLTYAKAVGADSVDGTSFSWFRDRWLNEFLDHAAGPRQEMLAL